VEKTLRALAARGLVEELPRQPGQKERRWRHLLGSGAVPEAPARARGFDDGEREGGERDDVAVPPLAPVAPVRALLQAPAAPWSPPRGAPSPATSGAEADVEARLAALERRVAELAAIVARLAAPSTTGD